ncbi:PP248 [Orf virus]|uniref:PP248 n=1 Tax=Orf virus TaxID=10258 RepID=F1AXD3_ORFV|nr:PP248 [Orf virus]
MRNARPLATSSFLDRCYHIAACRPHHQGFSPWLTRGWLRRAPQYLRAPQSPRTCGGGRLPSSACRVTSAPGQRHVCTSVLLETSTAYCRMVSMCFSRCRPAALLDSQHVFASAKVFSRGASSLSTRPGRTHAEPSTPTLNGVTLMFPS